MKLYVPVKREGASAAPYGFVFRLSRVDKGLALRMVAFGERHPTNPRTRSLYERSPPLEWPISVILEDVPTT